MGNEDEKTQSKKRLTFYFGYAFIWSFGASFGGNNMRHVDGLMREFF